VLGAVIENVPPESFTGLPPWQAVHVGSALNEPSAIAPVLDAGGPLLNADAGDPFRMDKRKSVQKSISTENLNQNRRINIFLCWLMVNRYSIRCFDCFTELLPMQKHTFRMETSIEAICSRSL
jgi:hypothetical protein